MVLKSWKEVRDSVSRGFAERSCYLLSESSWPGKGNEINERLLLRKGNSNLVVEVVYIAGGGKIQRVDYKAAFETSESSLANIKDKSKLPKVDEETESVLKGDISEIFGKIVKEGIKYPLPSFSSTKISKKSLIVNSSGRE